MDTVAKEMQLKLSGLFTEPRAANGETIVCRVHEAMEEAASLFRIVRFLW